MRRAGWLAWALRESGPTWLRAVLPGAKRRVPMGAGDGLLHERGPARTRLAR